MQESDMVCHDIFITGTKKCAKTGKKERKTTKKNNQKEKENDKEK